MKFCTKCVMPDTRPGITFNEEGVCIACQHAAHKKEIDWNQRLNELEQLCAKYRRKKEGEYDCIIAVSAGKDSHYQVHVMRKEAVRLVEEKDHNLDNKIRDDFCAFTGMTAKEFYEALDKLYNKEIFVKKQVWAMAFKT